MSRRFLFMEIGFHFWLFIIQNSRSKSRALAHTHTHTCTSSKKNACSKKWLMTSCACIDWVYRKQKVNEASSTHFYEYETAFKGKMNNKKNKEWKWFKKKHEALLCFFSLCLQLESCVFRCFISVGLERFLHMNYVHVNISRDYGNLNDIHKRVCVTRLSQCACLHFGMRMNGDSFPVIVVLASPTAPPLLATTLIFIKSVWTYIFITLYVHFALNLIFSHAYE